MGDDLRNCYNEERKLFSLPPDATFDEYVRRVTRGQHIRKCCGPYSGPKELYGRSSAAEYMANMIVDPPVIAGGVSCMTANEVMSRISPTITQYAPKPACMNRKLLLTKR